eukprot:5625640-Heterocapsa_arctica.AAC.1
MGKVSHGPADFEAIFPAIMDGEEMPQANLEDGQTPAATTPPTLAHPVPGSEGVAPSAGPSAMQQDGVNAARDGGVQEEAQMETGGAGDEDLWAARATLIGRAFLAALPSPPLP